MGGADVEVGGKGGASGIYVGGAEAGVEEGVSTLWACAGAISSLIARQCIQALQKDREYVVLASERFSGSSV